MSTFSDRQRDQEWSEKQARADEWREAAKAAAAPKTPASMTAGELVEAATAGGRWQVGGPYPGVSVIYCVESGTDIEPPIYEPVAFLGGGTAHLQAAIDAELIVRAVNSFAAMREVIEEAADICACEFPGLDENRLVVKLRAALALANGGGL